MIPASIIAAIGIAAFAVMCFAPEIAKWWK